MITNTDELIADVEVALKGIDASVIDPVLFERTGVAIVRGAFNPSEIAPYVELWDSHHGVSSNQQREIENKNNPVEVKKLPRELYDLCQSKNIVDKISAVFGDNIGLYQKRFVVKDKSSAGSVILHQDSGYHVGTFNKASVFLALKPVNAQNGAMYLYPGTHQFGYLGDAGSINPEILPAGWPKVTPELEPGDFLLMKSLTWHGSGPYISGNDRVMTDFIYQCAKDPSTKEIVSGNRGWTHSFLTQNRHGIFQSCRSSKLREISGVLNSTTQ